MSNKIYRYIFSILLVLGATSTPSLKAETIAPANTEKLSTEKAQTQDLSKEEILKVSEAFGHFIGRNLNAPGLKFDLESIIKGMREGSAGKPAPMTDKEYEEKMAILQEQAFKSLSETNLSAAQDFLKNNSKATGVIEIQPGKLQYLILENGSGAAVTANSTPQINYTGKYLDGSVFGSSDDMNGPVAVPLNQTIQGFGEGIIGMKEGEKRRLFVHPDLGYGTAGHLPPNSLLIFDIELVKADTQQDKDDEDSADDDLPPLSLDADTINNK